MAQLIIHAAMSATGKHRKESVSVIKMPDFPEPNILCALERGHWTCWQQFL
jgi:hypothetical protein